MAGFPSEYIPSLIIADLLMIFFVWLIMHKAAYSVFKGRKRVFYSLVVLVFLLIWFVSAFILAKQRFFVNLSFSFLPNVVLIFLPIIIVATILKNSSDFRVFVDNIKQHWLISLQVLRMMGVVFLFLYAMKLMPWEFAIPSGVGDVIIGTSAPFVAYIYSLKKSYSKKLAIIWNIIGICELALAIILGFFTSPTPYQALAVNNPNILLFDYPLALIPTFAVPLSIILHIFALRVLLKK